MCSISSTQSIEPVNPRLTAKDAREWASDVDRRVRLLAPNAEFNVRAEGNSVYLKGVATQEDKDQYFAMHPEYLRYITLYTRFDGNGEPDGTWGFDMVFTTVQDACHVQDCIFGIYARFG